VDTTKQSVASTTKGILHFITEAVGLLPPLQTVDKVRGFYLGFFLLGVFESRRKYRFSLALATFCDIIKVSKIGGGCL
jgi:hypothetical protein